MLSSKLKTLEEVADFCHPKVNLKLTLQKLIACKVLTHIA